MRQPRDPRRSHRARGIHWCHHLPKKTTGTPTLDRQNASKARHLPHSECPKCPKTVSSSPSEATKATTKPNAATTTSTQVTEAPQFTPTPPLSITTPTPAGRAETTSARPSFRVRIGRISRPLSRLRQPKDPKRCRIARRVQWYSHRSQIISRTCDSDTFCALIGHGSCRQSTLPYFGRSRGHQGPDPPNPGTLGDHSVHQEPIGTMIYPRKRPQHHLWIARTHKKPLTCPYLSDQNGQKMPAPPHQT